MARPLNFVALPTSLLVGVVHQMISCTTDVLMSVGIRRFV
jgi:hypothetical protein